MFVVGPPGIPGQGDGRTVVGPPGPPGKEKSRKEKSQEKIP